MPVLAAPSPPKPSSSTPNGSHKLNGESPQYYNGFSTSHSMQSIASSSTNGNFNGNMNHYEDENEGDGIDDEENSMHVDDDDDDGQSEASEEEEDRPVVHVEICLKSDLPINTKRKNNAQYMIRVYIEEELSNITLGKDLPGWKKKCPDLYELVERIWVAEGGLGTPEMNTNQVELRFHIYQLSQHDYPEDLVTGLDDDDGDDPVTSATMRTLPSLELDGIWNTLIYPDNLKARLLNYCYSTTFFSEHDIDFNVIAWNRVMLLHGPPGTGKTSLCRALAQKIAIRMNESYPTAKLIEINSHSLFSKWFSESGKLVQKLFDTVAREVDNEGQFVVVMIDEVESLTAARAAAMTGNEPSDSLRVVNALLTQLDRLRTRKNVLVMTTSNLVDAIDEAFMSRVDMLELVPLPPPEAVYSILKGCIEEMMYKNMIKKRELLPVDTAMKLAGGWLEWEDKVKSYSGGLAALAIRCHELEISGRTLRKLPVLAHTTKLSSFSGQNRKRPLGEWIRAMLEIINSMYSPKTSKSNITSKQVQRDIIDNVPHHINGHSRNLSNISLDKSHIGVAVATKGGKDLH